MRQLIIGVIKGYQRLISSWRPPSCRFYPTCSAYAIEAIRQHGTVKGGLMILRRLLSCHPFHPGGYNPVK